MSSIALLLEIAILSIALLKVVSSKALLIVVVILIVILSIALLKEVLSVALSIY